MVGIAERVGPWSSLTLRAKLELVGLTMLDDTQTKRSVHILLMPAGLRLASPDEDSSSDARWTEGESDLVWDRIDLMPQDPRDTLSCFWEFLDLAGVSDEAFPEAVVRFVKKWGLLDFGEDADYMDTEHEAWRDLRYWHDQVTEARSIVLAMVATAGGELVEEGVLRDICGLGESLQESTLDIKTWLRPDRSYVAMWPAWRQAQEDDWRARIQAERRAGRGLELQRLVVTNRLAEWVNVADFIPVWDEVERRVETVSRGVHDIWGGHLLGLFASSPLDVFLCSVCGRPYPLDDSTTQRRPRTGSRRFCSDECRAQAKRTANLASWHRNKARWTRRRADENATETQNPASEEEQHG